MAFEKLQNKMKKLNTAIKKGRITEEIADEISSVIHEVENLGDEAKNKFGSAISDMKKALKKMK